LGITKGAVGEVSRSYGFVKAPDEWKTNLVTVKGMVESKNPGASPVEIFIYGLMPQAVNERISVRYRRPTEVTQEFLIGGYMLSLQHPL